MLGLPFATIAGVAATVATLVFFGDQPTGWSASALWAYFAIWSFHNGY